MKRSEFNRMALFLVCLGLGAAVVPGTTLAAPPASAVPPASISVSGFGRGFTNAALHSLIARGVDAALAEGGAVSTDWSFSIQSAPGNRPQTHIVATLRAGGGRMVSGFFTSATLGTAPTDEFVEEIRVFAERLLRRSEA